MRMTSNDILFATAAFPFLVPLVATTDTQPTFSLCVLIFAALAAVLSFRESVRLNSSDMKLAAGIFTTGLLWLLASVIANGFAIGNLNRAASFVMFLVAVATGILQRHIFTPGRILFALKFYTFFTIVFVLTGGVIERVLVQSRPDNSFSDVAKGGRGASTLSPEQSFFAFQVFTLFIAARLMIWNTLSPQRRHAIQLMTIALLLSSLGGYGALYALVVVLISGWRYIWTAVGIGAAGLVFIAGRLDAESVRFVNLFLSLFADALRTGSLGVSDISTLGRLNSFVEYSRVFFAHPIFGDGFSTFGAGGLVSLPASIGLFGAGLVGLSLVAIFSLRATGGVKFALSVWFLMQFISGPIGLPFTGLLIGLVLATSRTGPILDALRLTKANLRTGARQASKGMATNE